MDMNLSLGFFFHSITAWKFWNDNISNSFAFIIVYTIYSCSSSKEVLLVEHSYVDVMSIPIGTCIIKLRSSLFKYSFVENSQRKGTGACEEFWDDTLWDTKIETRLSGTLVTIPKVIILGLNTLNGTKLLGVAYHFYKGVTPPLVGCILILKSCSTSSRHPCLTGPILVCCSCLLSSFTLFSNCDSRYLYT